MASQDTLDLYVAARHRLRHAQVDRERTLHAADLAEQGVKAADREQAALWARFVEEMNAEIDAALRPPTAQESTP